MKGKEYLQPITIKSHDRTTNDRNIMFYTPPTVIRRIGNGILSCCKCLGKYLLSDDNKKQLKALYPGFVFNKLAKFVRLGSSTSWDTWDSVDITFMQRTEYNKVPNVEMDFCRFYISNRDYQKWFDWTYGVLCHQSLVNIPELLTYCERLFHKNVLPVKKLVKYIADFYNLI